MQFKILVTFVHQMIILENKHMSKIYYFSFILILLANCKPSDNSKKEADSEISDPSLNKEQFESKIEKLMAETDLNDQLKVMNSLYFTKEDQSTLEVNAFLNKSEDIVKIEEKYSDGSTGEYGTHIFYINGGKKYATKERYEVKKAKKSTFVERISFYDQKKKVVQTKIRQAQFEEEVESQNFEFIAPYDCSIQRAMDAINQEGSFQTNFQGFITARGDTYLSVGESKENGYISTMLVQYHTTLTRKLQKDQEKYLGKKLNIEFQKMLEPSGFEYQILLSIAE